MGDEPPGQVESPIDSGDDRELQREHIPPTILAGTTNPQFSWSVVVWLAILALAALAALFIVAWRNGLAGVAVAGG